MWCSNARWILSLSAPGSTFSVYTTWIPGSAEPVYFGVHDEIADHYGVPRGSDAERTTTLDYVVAAAAG